MSTRSLAMLDKTFREFIRDRATLFWTMAWPAIWVILSSQIFTTNVPDEVLPQVMGAIAISMMGLALMTTGMVNLAGSIAGDKERGFYQKIASMPVKAWEDAFGRLGSLIIFAFLASLLVLAVGFIIGAGFNGSVIEVLQCIGYAVLMLLSSAGVGMILGSIVTSEGSATHIGVGITVITAAISGVFAPYTGLPEFLKRFSELYPPSSVISSITYLLEGEAYAGYNPLTIEHTIYTIISSLTVFTLGIIVYKHKLWTYR